MTSLPGMVRAPQAARICIPDLMAGVLTGTSNPGPVVDDETGLDHAADVYAARGERRAITSLVRMGSL